MRKHHMDIEAIANERTTTTTNQGNENTMRAMVQREFGGGEAIMLQEIAKPAVGDDQVLIEVHAAGLDRGVIHLMTGKPYLIRLMGYGFSRPKNAVPGLDVAGIVVAIGANVSRLGVGDEVFGIASGSFAEFAVADASKVSLKPDNISFNQAGVAAVSGITALQGLIDVAEVQAGQSLMVIGASGGVGSYAVQLGKALGLNVTGVASTEKIEFVRSLGADEVVDYTCEDYLDGSKRFDVIFDTGGRNPVRSLRRALEPKGTLVIVGGEGGDSIGGGIGRQLRAVVASPFVSQDLKMFMSKEHYSHMDRLAEFMKQRDVVPAIGATYELDDATAAVADLEEGRSRGKSVIRIR
jgi:NADPH:quinone reductase-like Zn-dependent oxidoreductase